MIHIPQNPNEVLHNRLRGGSDKEVPANSWGFQTRMGSAKISKLVQIFVQKFLSCCHYWWEGNCPGTCSEQGGLPEMRIVPIWQILLLCKSFRILHSQDFKGMASLKEILYHSEISSISNEQIYWATNRCSFDPLSFTHSFWWKQYSTISSPLLLPNLSYDQLTFKHKHHNIFHGTWNCHRSTIPFKITIFSKVQNLLRTSQLRAKKLISWNSVGDFPWDNHHHGKNREIPNLNLLGTPTAIIHDRGAVRQTGADFADEQNPGGGENPIMESVVVLVGKRERRAEVWGQLASEQNSIAAWPENSLSFWAE